MSYKFISSVAALALLASGGLVHAQGAGGKEMNGSAGEKGGGARAAGEQPGGERAGAKAGEKSGGAGAHRMDRADKPGADRSGEKADRGDKADHNADKADKADKADRNDRGVRDKGERAERGDRDRSARGDHREREDRVNVNIRVGGAVPQGRALRPLRTELITRYPQYRGFEMFEENDEIVIVDPGTRKIVRTVAQGEAGMNHRSKDCD